MDFSVELQKLLLEESFPVDSLVELAQIHTGLLDSIQKNDANISLQIEEIYDIIKDADENAKEVKIALKRENLLLNSLIAMSDLLDGLFPYLQEHNQTVAAKKEEIINNCGLEPVGFPGERLDTQLHTVSSAEYCDAPPETVIDILERGYAYRGKIIRKATVILSKGAETYDNRN